MSSPLIAVVLAAGGSTRFAAGPKVRAVVGGVPLVVRAIGAALAADCFDSVLVVEGAEPLDDLVGDLGVTIVPNAQWREGQATSVAIAVDAAADLGARSVVIGLCDQPGVGPEAWTLVATTSAPTPIVVAELGGVLAPPVRLDAEVWPLLPRSGDEGARSLWRGRPDLVTAVACPGSPDDIDTLEDLDAWN